MTISINILFNKAIKKNPLLTFEEEISLSRMVKKGDLEARKKLVESNYRLVISIAKKYYRKHCDFEDLLQESSAGLLKAVDRFDPELGYKFSTYASWWIKQSALQFLNENQTNIKVPTHSRILNNKIKKVISNFEKENDYTPSFEEISNITGENIKKLKYTLKANKAIISLDKENAVGKTFKDYISSNTVDESDYVNPEKALQNKELFKIIKDSLKLLSSKEEKIIRLRFGISECDSNTTEFPVTKEMIESFNE
jgi:RNA polymerase sigma factor (sigma-70 family)